MAISIAPSKALEKFFTSKLGTNEAASIIMSALITSANRPKVNIDKGAVKNHKAGRRKALIRPSTVAAIKNEIKFFDFIPGTISVAQARPTAVASQVINKAVMFECVKFSG